MYMYMHACMFTYEVDHAIHACTCTCTWASRWLWGVDKVHACVGVYMQGVHVHVHACLHVHLRG